jgi:trimeric autotransporter adhesin
MNPLSPIRCTMLPLTLAITLAAAMPATASTFVYDGRLDDMGQPASGRYDIQLAPFTTEKQGKALAATMTFEDVEVRDGRFRIDFDLALTEADSAWLELAIRASNDSTPFSTIPGRSKAIAAPLVGACWSTVGDSGVIAATNFLGTTDAQPINIRANGVQGWSMTGGTDGYVNILGGGQGLTSVNPPQILSGARGVFIGNGGKRLTGLTGGINEGNRVSDHNGVIAGGYGNLAGDLDANPDNGALATVGGGIFNQAIGTRSFVGGGDANRARGSVATVSGGIGNAALGAASMVPGGEAACAGGDFSFAAGRNAKVVAPIGATDPTCIASVVPGDTNGHEGSFVWADATNGNFVSTGPDQFLARASGGLAVNTAAIPAVMDVVLASRPANANFNLWMRPLAFNNGINLGVTATTNTSELFISRFDGTNSTIYATWQNDGRLRVLFDNPIKPTAGGWAAPSDARLKHHIDPLPTGTLDRLLALQGVTFEYNANAPKNYFVPGVHTGFVAQEVEKVFPDWVSNDESGFKLVAPKGFEALAVEALRELRVEKDIQIETLSAENVSLKTRLVAVEKQLGIIVKK